MNFGAMMNQKYHPITGNGWKWDIEAGMWVLYEDGYEIDRAVLAPWEEDLV